MEEITKKAEENVIINDISEETRKKIKKLNAKPKKTVKNPVVVATKTVNISTKKGGDIMSKRAAAEKVLEKVAKAMKLSTNRIAAKTTSKSGYGALQVLVGGKVKATVRDHDVVLYMPQDKIGYGRPGPGRWVHVTVLNHADPNLEKAFTKALKDKVTGVEWAKKMGFVPRAVAVQTKEVVEARIKRLEAELKAAKEAKATVVKVAKKTTTKKASVKKLKVSKKGIAAIAKVAVVKEA